MLTLGEGEDDWSTSFAAAWTICFFALEVFALEAVQQCAHASVAYGFGALRDLRLHGHVFCFSLARMNGLHSCIDLLVCLQF